MNVKKEINKYLFYEFGFDIEDDEEKVSENYPYDLNFTGEFKVDNEPIKVFEFLEDGDSNTVLYGNSLAIYKTVGMEVNDFYFQKLGSQWIRKREPINLNISKIGYDNIPSVNTRKAEIEKLSINKLGVTEKPIVLEGLFLVETQQYLALVQIGNDKFIVGSEIIEKIDKFNQLSAGRLLSYGIGRLLHRGLLE